MAKGARKGQLVTRAELAHIFGVTPPTVDQWIKQGVPVEERGSRGRAYQFNTARVREWREQMIRDQAAGTARVDEAELRRRELAAKTELAELTLAKEKRLVAPLDEIGRAVAKAFAEVRAGVRNVPSRVATQIVGETDEARLKAVLLAEIDQALEALSDADLITAEDIDEFGDDDASAQDDD